MTITITGETERRLRQEAERTGQVVEALAEMLLLEVLTQADDDEETRTAITEGFADMDAGRTIFFEDARAVWEGSRMTLRHSCSAARSTWGDHRGRGATDGARRIVMSAPISTIQLGG